MTKLATISSNSHNQQQRPHTVYEFVLLVRFLVVIQQYARIIIMYEYNYWHNYVPHPVIGDYYLKPLRLGNVLQAYHHSPKVEPARI